MKALIILAVLITFFVGPGTGVIIMSYKRRVYGKNMMMAAFFSLTMISLFVGIIAYSIL